MEVNLSDMHRNKKMNYTELVHNLIATACREENEDGNPLAYYSDTESLYEEEKTLDMVSLLRGVHDDLRK